MSIVITAQNSSRTFSIPTTFPTPDTRSASIALINTIIAKDRHSRFVKHQGRLYKSNDVVWIDDASRFKAIGKPVIDPDNPAFPYTIDGIIYTAQRRV